MVTLLISLVVLIAGYLFYSKYIERVFGANGSRATPAITMTDGVDYMPMPLSLASSISLSMYPALIMISLRLY